MPTPPIAAPAGFVPEVALTFANPDATSQPVSAANPLPAAAPTMRRTLAANTVIDMLAYGAVEFQCAAACTVTQSHDGANFLACPVADATSTSPSLVASASGSGIWSVSGGRWLKFSADVTLVGSN